MVSSCEKDMSKGATLAGVWDGGRTMSKMTASAKKVVSVLLDM